MIESSPSYFSSTFEPLSPFFPLSLPPMPSEDVPPPGCSSTSSSCSPSASSPSTSSSFSFDFLPSMEDELPAPNGLKLFLRSPFPTPYVVGEDGSQKRYLGRYLYIEDKRFGVEPGFEGVKFWTDADSQLLKAADLLERKPKYHRAISEFIGEQIRKSPIDPVYRDLIQASAIDPHDQQKLIDYIRTANHPAVNAAMETFARDNILKFHKRHFIKLDYPEPEKGLDLVSIPLERAKKVSDKLMTSTPALGRFIKALSFVDAVGQRMHQLGRQATIREMNLGAVKEALANDIYEAWGFGGQNLRIIHTEYLNGRSKLLLDGAEVQGKQGERFHTFAGQIKHGHLENNSICGEDGVFYPLDTKELGRAKVMALLMADFDKIGSEGRNLGFVVEGGQVKLKNIDPGKALESKIEGRTDLMAQKNLHTDLSFDQPTDTLKDRSVGGYKNFTIFDDTLLSERMQGMRDVMEAWKKTCQIFRSYIDAFGGSDRNEGLSFKAELQESFTRLSDRKNYFEQVLMERLTLLELGSDKLDFLDNVEKLTSETIDHVGPDSDPLFLTHLKVISETRKEWHMVQGAEGGYCLYFAGTEDEAKAATMRINDFLSRDDEFTHLKSSVNRDEGVVLITIKSEESVSQFIQAISEERIANYKKSYL